jgi:hypothetical protein
VHDASSSRDAHRSGHRLARRLSDRARRQFTSA